MTVVMTAVMVVATTVVGGHNHGHTVMTVVTDHDHMVMTTVVS